MIYYFYSIAWKYNITMVSSKCEQVNEMSHECNESNVNKTVSTGIVRRYPIMNCNRVDILQVRANNLIEY